ncbi:MAG: UvrD-helicase domain-containing protein [Clostridia bacterium]|nr:UvrD-helicase domain-containing protein [Clostridia bacterium]
MHFTDEQRRAIDARGTNILLSAAAGSGKTTVLVERVLELISSGGTRIDRMLIVTFTRAASSDMRAKLTQELGRRAAAGDEVCRDQLLLMDRASITTLHGFCAEFLRTHFESAGVDPAFRVLDDAEARRLLDEALDEAVEEAYADPDDRLTQLDYARGPKGVRAMAEILLRRLEERPDPEDWLRMACAPDDALCRRWLDEMLRAARNDVDRALLMTRLALMHPGCNANYAGALEKDLLVLAQMRQIDSYDELQRALAGFKQAPAGKKRDCGPVDEAVKKLRSDAKSAIERSALRGLELGTALSDVKLLAPQLSRLGEIALRAREGYEARKAELSALSYADLEHRTLRSLKDDDTARALRQSYDYIFVDEYQDTSDVQEALVSRIARGDNLFMVGDVKQSIYRFRQAEPRLFLEKYASYERGDGGMLLPLTMNFRSRPAILSFVNRVFGRAMQGGDSEIVYDANARLNHGNAALTGGDVEIHLLQAPDSSEASEDILEMKTCEREALFIAGRIRELMTANPELKYRDFAVLTRAKRGVLGRMAAILTQQGIPAFADGSEDFYESVEISLALSLLKLVANRRSDVELIGVLRSPAVGLSAGELAQLRIAQPDAPFVDAALSYARGEDELAHRLRAFFDLLERWQLMSLCTELGVLLRTILEESGLYDCAGALPGGPQRQANLNRLIANAAAFDQSISGALTRFLLHTEKLRARGEGDGAQLLGENDDVVRLMTVHKSKGLEFPVVFGAMMNRRYGSGGRGEALSAHRDLGLGCLYCDPELQTRRKTLPQLAIAEREKREDRAEELRILYVLLTRAKDHLILTGSVSSIDSARARWTALSDAPGAANSYLDVILPALDEDGGEYARIEAHLSPAEAQEEAADVQEALAIPDGADAELVRAITWKYPDEAGARMPLKLTVTGLLRQLQAPEAVEELVERPAFMSEVPGQMTGAERGTAYHRAMQCLELAPLRGLSGRALVDEIRVQMDGLAACGRIRPEQRAAVRPSALAQFFAGETGARLLAADEVQREWPFNVLLRASEALTEAEAAGMPDGEMLVQGSIDCCFMENGVWVLLDYKTDRSDDAAALTRRYRNQLRLYALALERITGIAVREIRLCLLRSGETLEIPRSEAADDGKDW